MKLPVLLLSIIALALPLSTLAATAAPHEHGATPTHIELNAGKKWASDASLRQATSAMRDQIGSALPAAHAGQLSTAQYQALATDLTTQVTYIVQNCKLEPKADAQLHVLIGQLGDAIETISGKQGDARADGVLKVAQTLNSYGKHFQHPGWQPLKIEH